MKNVILFIGLILSALSANAGAGAGAFNLVEINPAHGYSDYIYGDTNKYIYGAGDLKHFARMNGLLYFVGTDQPYNDELWVTDGTQQGTHKIKEINPNGGAHIGDLRVVNNKLMFLANETTTDNNLTDDFDLFTSDGTASGTTKVSDLNLDQNTLLADQNAGIINGKLVFCTRTDVIVSDATTTGTRSIASINIVSYTGANGYCEMKGSVYFIVNSDIWKSDGTASGTHVVKTLDSAVSVWPLAFANTIKAFDNKLYIIGSMTNQGDDLYTFDGTENGAVTKVVAMPQGNTYPGSLNICGGSLWFTAYDTIGNGVYKLTSSNATPQRVAESPSALSYGSSKVYYPNTAGNGYNVIDANTNAITSFSKSGYNFSGLGFPSGNNSILELGNKVIYLAYDSATGQQVMCITDGTSAGIRVVMPTGTTVAHPFDYTPGCGIIDVFDLTYYGDKLVIPADFNNAGRELWFYEEAGMVNGIQDVESSTIAIYPNPAKDAVTIDLSKENTISGDLSIQILDINGRMVSENKAGADKVQISCSDLANGAYIISVNNGTEAITRRKLIVAH